MVRFATVGTGWIVDSFLEGAAMVEGLRHTAVYSRDAARAEAFAARHGVEKTFTDLQALAGSDEIDAVYIASPNSLHYAQSMLMLEHGKHVLCEKPVAAHPEEAQELLHTAGLHGVVFMEAIIPVHLPRAAALEEAVRGIGPVSLARLDFSQYSSKYPEYLAGELPNIFNPAFQTGALMDVGVYCVYMALRLFGRPERLTASATFLASGADAAGAALFEYPHMQAVLTYSKVGQSRRGSEILGENGTVAMDSVSRIESLRRIDLKGDVHSLFGLEDKGIQMSHEARDFLACIEDEQQDGSRYAYWSTLCHDVSATLYGMRRCAGIRFPGDDF